ncbi:hypothetical protein [Paracoccus chinensis]|uniref:Uncharacterized protein n=1 Tax=Paracoccus chinensis TaxID=525640 RepID=A0A1G9JHZ8_9RHOB|nr:hypothetical protein [Paracoccus chinensis]SDL37217.1 hypothetical protein SAMN04487971_109146 [Paracoccus chinensis]
MAEKNVNVRLVATGGGQVRAELSEIGKTGQAAFTGVGVSADSASRRLKGVGDAANDAGGKMAGAVDGMRMTTMQLSQVAQQGAATGQWMQAFAIQLPDLALGFGPVGIAAGAVSGALLMLAPAFLGAGRDAEIMKDKLSAADQAIQALAHSAKASQMSLADMQKAYGNSADEVERLNRAQLAFSRADVARKMADAMKALGLSQGSFEGGVQGPQQPGMFDWLTDGRSATKQSEYQATLTRLQVQYRLSAEQARALAQALRQVATASEGEEALSAAANLQEVMLEVAGSADKAAEKFGGEDGLWDAASKAADLARQNVEAVTTATREMTLSFETGITTLERLRGTLDSMLPGAGGVLDQVGGWFQGFRDKASGEFGSASKGILDLIGWAEGTDKGRGYNETLDYGRWTGGPVNLVNMTLDDVLALGERMRTPENRALYPGGGSSALGRYQIVGKTMRGLMKTMGLTGDELFDEQMQDRMAMELVRQTAQIGTKSAWDNQWQSFKTKNVSLAAITGALGVKSVGVDPAVEAARKKENDELQRGLDLRADFMVALQDQANAAALEAQVTGQSVYEQVRLRTEMTLTQQARAKGIDLTEQIAGSEKTYGQAIKETAASLAASAQEQAAQEGRFKAAEDAAKRAADTMRKFQDDLKQGFRSAFQSVIDGTESVADAFRNMIADMLMQRAMLGFDGLIDGLLGAAFGGGDPLANALTGAGLTDVRPQNWITRAASAVTQQAVQVNVGVDPRNGNLMAFTDQRVAAGLRQADRAMPSRLTTINRDPLKRG